MFKSVPWSNALRAFCFTAAMGAALALAVGCATPDSRPRLTDEAIARLLASPDRTAADRGNDTRRKPQQMLAFSGVAPGMRVLDLGAGGGYSTELMARAVGPQGRVWAQNDRVDAAGRERFAARIKAVAPTPLTLHEQSFSDPVPAEIAPGSLDMVTFFFVYHDQVNPAVDRARMNRAV